MKVLELGTRKYQKLQNFNISLSPSFNLVYSDKKEEVFNFSSLINHLLSVKNLKVFSASTTTLGQVKASRAEDKATGYVKFKLSHDVKPFPELLDIEKDFSTNTNKLFNGISGDLLDENFSLSQHRDLFSHLSYSNIPLEYIQNISLHSPTVPLETQVEKNYFTVFPLFTQNRSEENSMSEALKKLSDFKNTELKITGDNSFSDMNRQLKGLAKKEQDLLSTIEKHQLQIKSESESNHRNAIKNEQNMLELREAHFTLQGMEQIKDKFYRYEDEINHLEEQKNEIQMVIESVGEIHSIQDKPVLEHFAEYMQLLKIKKGSSNSNQSESHQIFQKYADDYLDLIKKIESADTLEAKYQELDQNSEEKSKLLKNIRWMTYTKSFLLATSFLILPFFLWLLFNRKHKFIQKKALYLVEKEKSIRIQLEELESAHLIRDEIFKNLNINSIAELKEVMPSEPPLPNMTEKDMDRFNKLKEVISSYLTTANLFFDENTLSDYSLVESIYNLFKKYNKLTLDQSYINQQQRNLTTAQKKLLGESSIQEVEDFIEKLKSGLKDLPDLPETNSNDLKIQQNQANQTLLKLKKEEEKRIARIDHLNKEVERKNLELKEVRKEIRLINIDLDHYKKQKSCVDQASEVLNQMKEKVSNSIIPIYLHQMFNQRIKRYTKDAFTTIKVSSGVFEVFSPKENRFVRLTNIEKETQELIIFAIRLSLMELISAEIDSLPFVLNPQLLQMDPETLDLLLDDLVEISKQLQVILISPNKKLRENFQTWKNSQSQQITEEKQFSSFALFTLEHSNG